MNDRLFDDSEERVDTMLASGHEIMRQALNEFKPVAVFAGLSGGNDSIVATHFACSEYGAAAVHCNTLIGLDQTRNHARAACRARNWQLIEMQAVANGPPKHHRDGSPFDQTSLPCGRWVDGATAYEEFCFNFGMPGPGQHARMYQRLKERSFERLKREAKQGQPRTACVAIVTGVRHDESAIRAGYQRAVQKCGGTVWINPFYWSTKTDFHLYREEFGLPLNPVSGKIGISGECLCGTMGSRAELDAIRIVDAPTAQYIEGLESKCESLGLPCRWASAPTERRASCQQSDGLTQLRLFGDEPEFMPACVGCIRRQANPAA